MITKNEAITTLRGLLPPNKKLFFHVTGEALQTPNMAIWAFQFLLAKQGEIIQVSPLICAILGYRTTDTEYLRVRDTADLAQITAKLQNMITAALPEDGILLTDLAAALNIVEISLIGQGGNGLIPAIPAEFTILDPDDA